MKKTLAKELVRVMPSEDVDMCLEEKFHDLHISRAASSHNNPFKTRSRRYSNPFDISPILRHKHDAPRFGAKDQDYGNSNTEKKTGFPGQSRPSLIRLLTKKKFCPPSPNGIVANGPVATPPVANGPVTNGPVTNGPVANGHVPRGPVANVSVVNQSVVNRSVANGSAAGYLSTPAREMKAPNGAIPPAVAKTLPKATRYLLQRRNSLPDDLVLKGKDEDQPKSGRLRRASSLDEKDESTEPAESSQRITGQNVNMLRRVQRLHSTKKLLAIQGQEARQYFPARESAGAGVGAGVGSPKPVREKNLRTQLLERKLGQSLGKKIMKTLTEPPPEEEVNENIHRRKRVMHTDTMKEYTLYAKRPRYSPSPTTPNPRRKTLQPPNCRSSRRRRSPNRGVRNLFANPRADQDLNKSPPARPPSPDISFFQSDPNAPDIQSFSPPKLFTRSPISLDKLHIKNPTQQYSSTSRSKRLNSETLSPINSLKFQKISSSFALRSPQPHTQPPPTDLDSPVPQLHPQPDPFYQLQTTNLESILPQPMLLKLQTNQLREDQQSRFSVICPRPRKVQPILQSSHASFQPLKILTSPRNAPMTRPNTPMPSMSLKIPPDMEDVLADLPPIIPPERPAISPAKLFESDVKMA